VLLEEQARRTGRRGMRVTADGLAKLAAYDWPGNLRELARVVAAAHAAGSGDWVEAEDLPAAIRGSLGAAYLPPPLPSPITPLDELLTQVERRLIENALQRARHNKSRAAELLGISRPRLYRRIKELNLPDVPDPADELPTTIENHS
jgi:DNA-binding NtrC family response regulator